MQIKRMLNQHPKLTAGQIIEKIKGCNVVSFDIFDTLLKRDVAEPADVFDYVERKFNQQYGRIINSFRKNRVDAWKKAADAAGDREISIQEIYAQIVKTNGNAIDEETAQKLMQIELELEEELCTPNPIMQEVYRYCVREGKRVLCISDMYLEKEFIAKLLSKSGYTGIDKIYVSSEAGVKKTNGELFKYVLKKEQLRADELVHVGDSKRGDLLAARKVGIRTVCIARYDWHTQYWRPGNDLDAGAVRSFLSNRLPYITDRREAIGYEVFGPLLYTFVKWLCKELDPRKPILFFARDCYIVKQAYDIMTGSDSGEYFLASRKSLMMPAIYVDSSVDLAVKMLRSEVPIISLQDILKKFGLDADNYRELLEHHGLPLTTTFWRDGLAEDSRFASLWSILDGDLRQNAKRDYEGFCSYFSEFGAGKEIQVVDIGWHCTMQYCLQRILKDKNTIKGFYMGVREGTFIEKPNYDGFFIDGCDPKKKSFIAEITGLLETFFSAPHGSVKGYETDGTVIYEPYERQNDVSGEQLIEKLHCGAMRFIRDIMNSPLHQMIPADPKYLFLGLEPLAAKPMKIDIDMFADISFQTGFGTVKMAAPKTISYYVVHPKQCVHDFVNSYWKIAFMKKLFKLPLPYDKLFAFMQHHKDKLSKTL